MTVKEIVEQYLRQNGYTGLLSQDMECGCDIDDLVPCNGDCIEHCEPGYKAACKCEDHDGWHIQATPPQEGK